MKKTGREPIFPGKDRKPFKMISLQKIRQQLPWIDILTKNTGGWGVVLLEPEQFLPRVANPHKIPQRNGPARGLTL